jgi:hypothetical protein
MNLIWKDITQVVPQLFGGINDRVTRGSIGLLTKLAKKVELRTIGSCDQPIAAVPRTSLPEL